MFFFVDNKFNLNFFFENISYSILFIKIKILTVSKSICNTSSALKVLVNDNVY